MFFRSALSSRIEKKKRQKLHAGCDLAADFVGSCFRERKREFSRCSIDVGISIVMFLSLSLFF